MLSGCHAGAVAAVGLSNFQIQPRIMLTSHLRFHRGGNLLILGRIERERESADVQKLPPCWRGPKSDFFLAAARQVEDLKRMNIYVC
jgi:hypothetical protein